MKLINFDWTQIYQIIKLFNTQLNQYIVMSLILGSQPKVKHEKEIKTKECKEVSPNILK
jgi:hypothetical protein